MHVKSLGLALRLANARPPGNAKFANANVLSGCPKRQELTVHTVTTAFELGFCFIYIRN